MPKQTATSGVLKQFRGQLAAAFEEHKNDPVEYGRVQIPPGINNGIARLVECKFDLYKTGQNQGKPYFRAAAVCVEPETVNVGGKEVPAAGLQTSIMIPLCETKTQAGKVTSASDRVAEVLNEMKKLGGPDFVADATVDDLESLAAALKEAAPHFRFSTSVRKAMTAGQTDGVWENWHGAKGLEDYSAPDAGGVDDGTAEAPPAAPARPAAARPGTRPAPRAPEPEPDPEPAEAFDEFGDLDSLAKKASGKGKVADDAAAELTEIAIKAGMSEDEIGEAESWDAIVERIKGGGGDQGATGGDEPEDGDQGEQAWEPAVDEVYKYRPTVVDPKTKKKVPAKKTLDVKIVRVSSDAQTVDVRDLATKDTHKGVPWASLESAD